jgi:hypothetical protein
VSKRKKIRKLRKKLARMRNITRYRDIAHELVSWMDMMEYTLEDTRDRYKPVPEGILRDFRKAVDADQPDDDPSEQHDGRAASLVPKRD